MDRWNVFNNWTFKKDFWKTIKRTHTKKQLENHFWVESTTIENATFEYKNNLSKANIKTYWIGKTYKKRNYHEERSFATLYFISWKLRTVINSWFNIPTMQMCTFIFFVSVWFLFEGEFCLWVSIPEKML